MLTPTALQLLQRAGALRRHRRGVSQYVYHEPAIQLLPALLDLPLPPFGTAGATAALLAHNAYLGLCGPTGSGRSLALLQLAWHAATSRQAEPVLLLPLAHADRPDRSPRAVLAGAIRRSGLPAPFDSRVPPASRAPWLLLLDEWELLSPARQADWRAFVLDLPKFWPEARLVLTLPEADEGWPGLEMVGLTPPDDIVLRIWLGYLLPRHDIAPILEALEPGAPLAFLRDRLLEIILLALVYPDRGLPVSRTQLYKQVYRRISAVQPEPPADERRASRAGDRWSAASSQWPSSWSFLFRALRRYELARDLAGTGDLAPFAQLEGADRAEVALLLAGMLSDMTPLFRELWGPDPSTPAQLLTLGRCLREQPAGARAWGLRVLAALAVEQESAPNRMLVQALGLLLPTILATAGGAIADAQAGALLAELAPALGGPALALLLDNPAVRPALRWAAADALQRLPSATARAALDATSPPDALAQAARSYVLALGSAEERRRLAAPERLGWATTLLDRRVDQQRRTQVANALLSDREMPITLRTAALALIPQADDETVQTILALACSDPDAQVRGGALTALRSRPPQQALLVLSDCVFSTNAPWEAQHDALEQLAHYPQSEVVAVLARCALALQLPLVGRLRALALLAARRDAGLRLLRRLLRVEALHPAVRATTARLLGKLSAAEALPDLRRLAAAQAPALVRWGAIEALGLLGQRPEHQSEALDSLLAILDAPTSDPELILCAVRAFGVLGAAASVPALCAWLGAETSARLRAAWLVRAPQLAELPADEWLAIELPAETRVALLTALTEGESDASQPGSFDELVEQDAANIRSATAEALARISRHADATTREAARAALLDALQRTAPGLVARRLLACLASVSEDGGLSDLGELLSNPTLDPALRWLAVEQLGANLSAGPLLLRYLEQGGDWGLGIGDWEQRAIPSPQSPVLSPQSQKGTPEPFIAGKLAQVLGQHGSTLALLALRQIVEQSDGNLYLRMQAVGALGALAAPAAEAALLPVLADARAPATLRGAAAEALPAALRPETRHLLRELLNQERQQPELLAGSLRALGRARDRESLALMLYYIHSEHMPVALAALDAVEKVGDARAGPALLQVAQDDDAEPGVRLQAVGALLRLCGEEHLSLLRDFLESGALPLQLRALDLLLALRPGDPRLLVLVADKAAPLALRLRAIDALAERVEDHNVLCALLLDNSEAAQVRARAAIVLGRAGELNAIAALMRGAREIDAPPSVRYRCIAALVEPARSQRAHTAAAQLALSQIADDPTQPDESRAWATHALCQ